METPLKKISTRIFELGEEKRRIELATNVAKSVYESETKKANDAAEAATVLQTRIEELSRSVQEVGNLGNISIEKADDTITAAVEVLREVGRISESALESIKRADLTITKRLEELVVAKEEDARRNEMLVKEGERLNVLKKDLDIYRKRLQTRYNELGLGELIL